MKKTLINEFEEYSDIKPNEIKNMTSISTTKTLLIILRYELDINESKTLKILDKNKDNSTPSYKFTFKKFKSRKR